MTELDRMMNNVMALANKNILTEEEALEVLKYMNSPEKKEKSAYTSEEDE